MAKEKAKRWFSVAKAADGSSARIKIFNNIGDFGVTAGDFSNELDEVGGVKTLNIEISSDGGDVSQGFAIFNMLDNHKAWKVVTVQGLAASMASVIAMVGDEVIMPENAMMMIHNPWGALMGEADQILSFGEALETMQENIADAYVARTNIPKAKVLAMMARETWLSAKKAKELGFADTVGSAVQIAASYDVSKYHNVPAKFARTNEGVRAMTTKAQREAARIAAAAAESDSDDGDASNVKTAAEIRTEVLAHGREIRSLCNLAGKPNLADGFINADKSISEVIAALDKAKNGTAADGKGKGKGEDAELQTQNSGRSEDRPAAVIDPKAIYSRWNGKTKK